MKKTFFKVYRLLFEDSLYKNSIYLMLSTAVMALLGFLFWIINARFYSSEQVGIGTALISVMALISNFSLLGLGNGLIRYLPASGQKNKKINTSFVIVILMSILVSAIYLIFIKTFSPKLLFIRENVTFSLLFVLLTVFFSLNVLVEYVFIAYRTTKFVLLKNTISNIIKLILPIIFVTFGAFGIYMSMGISMAVAFLIGVIFLVFRFSYIPKPIISKSIVKNMTKFALGNYVGELIGILPVTVLPIILINSLGAKFSAYYYMDMMIANLMYIIPKATSQSLFAEGSYIETELKNLLKKVTKIVSILIIPIIIIISFFGNYILLAFGKEYSYEGFALLRYFSISGIFISINSITNSILNIKHKIKLIVLLSFINSGVIISLSICLVKFSILGIISVGIGWVVGQGIEAIICLFLIKRFVK